MADNTASPLSNDGPGADLVAGPTEAATHGPQAEDSEPATTQETKIEPFTRALAGLRAVATTEGDSATTEGEETEAEGTPAAARAMLEVRFWHKIQKAC